MKKPAAKPRTWAAWALLAGMSWSTLTARAQEPRRVLTLAEALRTAETHQPSLRMAEADARAAQARADITRADWLPQVTGTASYQRMTGNFVGPPPWG